ncbi:TetR/AcrR family transcriptional regulator [Amycolatopsis iheyensis]|uniref:TetR/AcrR family transcriptional regulator n=1 Tax=Amycolatopsis iheyensis TaxID=2945988 RepID=UPI002152E3B2|nr:TetR family transcriptional regulator [Amycolatopsis iheyensis]
MSAARQLLADGLSPTVEDAATKAAISRTTAYRYFATQRALLLAAHPEVRPGTSLLPADAPSDPVARLELVMREFTRITVEWEPQLRAQLRLSLEPGAGQPELRQGRAIGWIEEALSPLGGTHPGIDIHALAVSIRSATGIESLVWLTDVGGLDRAAASATMTRSALAILRAAMEP